ncbi:2Fe-2S iron-sulfur cluster-binding protein [Streptomyces abikoensis]
MVHGGPAQEAAGAAPAPEPWTAQPVDDSWRQSLAAATPAAGTPLMSADDGGVGARGTGQWSVPVVSGEAADASDTSGEYALDGLTGPVAENSASAEPPAVDVNVTGAFTVPQYVTEVTGTGDNPGGAEAAAQVTDAVAVAEEPGRPEELAQQEQPEEPQQPTLPEPQQPMHAESFGHAEHHAAEGPEQTRQPELPELPEVPEQAEQQHGMPTMPEPFVPQQGGPESAAAHAPAGPEADAEPVAEAVTAADAPAPEGAAPHDPLGADPLGPLGPDPLAPHTEHPCASYVLRVNGTDRPVTDAWIGESLLYVLRERLGLAGAKDGCSQGECGACSVQVDGRLVASCLVPAATTAGSEVRTVEGLAVDGRPSDVQRALAECGAVQCGFCVPGMAMTMHDLLEGNHAPTELETRRAICGNLCRCSGYRGVLDAVRQVVEEREAAAAHEQELQQDFPQGQDLQQGLEQGLEQGFDPQQYEAVQAGQTVHADADQARIPHQAGPHGGGSGRATA